jgi:hypothetical protein
MNFLSRIVLIGQDSGFSFFSLALPIFTLLSKLPSAATAEGVSYADDVLLGLDFNQNRTEGTRRFYDFVDFFLRKYEACHDLQRPSLLRNVLYQWRTQFDHPIRFLVRAGEGWDAVTEDKRILDSIRDRLMYLMPRTTADAETDSSTGSCLEHLQKEGACASPLKRAVRGHLRHSDPTSILEKFGAIRAFVKEGVAVSPQEERFYFDARNNLVTDCDPSQLPIPDMLTLVRLGKKHSLGLSDWESKRVDRIHGNDSGPPVFTPTCHDVVVAFGFEICDTFGQKRFFDLLRMFKVEVGSAPARKEALLVVGKVLQMWEGLVPPGRFLQCSGEQGSDEASEWVIASFRTSVRATLRCFKLLNSAGQTEVAESGCVVKSSRVVGEVRITRHDQCCPVLILFSWRHSAL